MSIQSEITRINSEVSEQESLINQIKTALEGKAAGGGGGSVETCTVNLKITSGARLYAYGYTYINDGKAFSSYVDYGTAISNTEFLLNNVPCGSFLYVSAGASSLAVICTEDIQCLNDTFSYFSAPTTGGITGTIEFYDD